MKDYSKTLERRETRKRRQEDFYAVLMGAFGGATLMLLGYILRLVQEGL